MKTVSTILAHILAFYLVFVLPVLGGKSFRELGRAVYVDPCAKVRFYRSNLYFGWVTVVVLAAIMAPVTDPFRTIGLRLSANGYDYRFAVGIAIAVVYTVIMFRKPSPDYIRTYLMPVAALLPFTMEERRLWAAVSVKAGVVEELMYRGFLFYYLARYALGIPIFLVIAISAAVFGFVHIYQGVRGVVVSFLAGVVFGIIYFLTGSLLPVMIAHALTDLRILRVWKPHTANKLPLSAD